MKYQLAVSSGAKVDLRSISLWYESIDPNLARRFVVETDTTLERITKYPYSFQLINGAVRRANLKRIPYSVYYSVRNNEVFIITILHQHRSETVWRNRSHGQY